MGIDNSNLLEKRLLVDLVVPSLSPRSGGTTRSVIQLAGALSQKSDIQIEVVTQAHANDAQTIRRSAAVRTHIGTASSGWKLSLGLAGKTLYSKVVAQRRPEIIHSNGLWHPFNHWFSAFARQHRIPLVLQPHGMLEPWALTWHENKKRLALMFYQRMDLESVSLFMATSDQEAESIRKLGFRQPIAVIPNGIESSDKCYVVKRRQDFSKEKPRRALFLSRIHPKKGLINLVNAWALANASDWVLQIAGPDEGGHLSEVFTLAKRLGVADQIEYLGEFDDREKWRVYSEADLFVLPTFSENFGIVIAEALAAGLPVITTTGTPWKLLHTNNCGWWVSPTTDGLRKALNEAFCLPLERLQEMGERGRNCAQCFDWVDIADKMVEVYRWVVDQRQKPSCVRLS